jgi:VanZ family protein
MPSDPYRRATPACLLSENTYPGVIKAESIKGQLEVKILVDLWYGIVDVCLVVSIAVVAAFVKETVQEFFADSRQASLSDDVGSFFRSNSLGWWSVSVVFAI